MRVLFVINGLDYGGAERIVEALALDLIGRGVEVRVVATTRGGPIADAMTSAGIEVSVLGIRSPFDLRVVSQLARVVRTFRPDVIHSHLAVSDIAVALASSLVRGSKRITTVHNPGVELGLAKRILWHRALKHFDRIIAVSDSVKDQLPSELPATVIHPSLVDLDRPHPSREEIRARLNVGPDEIVVMAIGRLTSIKGFDVLASAAQQLRSENLRFILVGDGPERASLEGTRLELLGSRADAEDLLLGADMVVCPSRSEGFPQVPLLALAAACPVIATPVGGMPEIVLDDRTGVLVPVEAPGPLARSIERLMDETERRRLGSAGPTHLREAGLLRSTMCERTLRQYEFPT